MPRLGSWRPLRDLIVVGTVGVRVPFAHSRDVNTHENRDNMVVTLYKTRAMTLNICTLHPTCMRTRSTSLGAASRRDLSSLASDPPSHVPRRSDRKSRPADARRPPEEGRRCGHGQPRATRAKREVLAHKAADAPRSDASRRRHEKEGAREGVRERTASAPEVRGWRGSISDRLDGIDDACQAPQLHLCGHRQAGKRRRAQTAEAVWTRRVGELEKRTSCWERAVSRWPRRSPWGPYAMPSKRPRRNRSNCRLRSSSRRAVSWTGDERGASWSSMPRSLAGRRRAPPTSSRRWRKGARAPSGARPARRLASARGALAAFLLLRSRRAAQLEGDGRKMSRDQSRLSGWVRGAAAASSDHFLFARSSCEFHLGPPHTVAAPMCIFFARPGAAPPATLDPPR